MIVENKTGTQIEFLVVVKQETSGICLTSFAGVTPGDYFSSFCPYYLTVASVPLILTCCRIPVTSGQETHTNSYK